MKYQAVHGLCIHEQGLVSLETFLESQEQRWEAVFVVGYFHSIRYSCQAVSSADALLKQKVAGRVRAFNPGASLSVRPAFRKIHPC